VLPATPKTLRNYLTGDREPFRDWLRGLRDAQGRNIIRARLNRLQAGNFGNCEPVGEGVQELKIDFGPGYRVYFGIDGDTVVLLCGSDKDSQQRAIAVAKERWQDYNA